MTWLTWRQHRWEAACVLTVVVVFGAAALLLSVADSSLLAEIARNCQLNSLGAVASACGSQPSEFSVTFQPDWSSLVVVGTVIPALVGMFVGAPLIARETENGTCFLVWSQGITRRRWFVERIGWVMLGSVVGASGLAVAAQGWFGMQRGVGTTLSVSLWDGFEIGAPVLVAYTVFALGLGVAAGATLRRTVPAMGATLVGFVVVRVAIALLVRPLYIAPLVARAAATSDQSGFSFHGLGGSELSSEWPVGSITLTNAAGRPIPNVGFCVGSGPHCYSEVFAIQHFQPGDRFWIFQWIEAAIFVGLALVLVVLAYRMTMRVR